jgi:hypothetical protein
VAAELRLVDRGHVGLDVSGGQSIDPYSERSPFPGEATGEVVHAAFDALYAGCHCGRLTMSADIEPMLMMTPERWPTNWRPKVRAHCQRRPG